MWVFSFKDAQPFTHIPRSRLEEARDLRFEYDDLQVRRSRPRTGDSVEFKVVELPDGKTIAVRIF